MSKSIQRIRFGQLGPNPVVMGGDKLYIYLATTKRWQSLPERRKQEVIPIKQATFLRRFGTVVDNLPRGLRRIAPPLRIASDPSQTVGFCRSGSTPTAGCARNWPPISKPIPRSWRRTQC